MSKLLTFTIPGANGQPQEIQAPDTVPQGGIEPGGEGRSIIENGMGIFLILVVVLSLIFLIWGGIKYITAAGDKTKIDAARKTIIYSLIGLVLAFLSYTIVSLVGQQFGISFF